MSPQKAIVTKSPRKADRAKTLRARDVVYVNTPKQVAEREERKASARKASKASKLEGQLALSIEREESRRDTVETFVGRLEGLLTDVATRAVAVATGQTSPAPQLPAPPVVVPDLKSYSAAVKDHTYAGKWRDDPSKTDIKADRVRFSGAITGHVMHVRGEQRFQVDLTDENNLQIAQVMVPAILSGRVTSIQRSVAFREAVRLAGWMDRAELTPGGKVKVSKLGRKATVRVTSRDESKRDRIIAPPHSQAIPVEQIAEVETELAAATKRVEAARSALAAASAELARALGTLGK